VVEATRAAFLQAGLPHRFWLLAARHQALAAASIMESPKAVHFLGRFAQFLFCGVAFIVRVTWAIFAAESRSEKLAEISPQDDPRRFREVGC